MSRSIPSTVPGLLETDLPKRSDRVAVVSANESVTYGQLAARVDALAGFLASVGVRPDDRVAIHLRKSVEEIVATFAIARIGAVFVNINWQCTVAQVDYIVRDCGTRVLFADPRKARALHEAGVLDRLSSLIVCGPAPEHSAAVAWADLPSSSDAPTVGIDPEDLAALIYTSGSTGQPKGVMLTHRNITDGAAIVSSYLNNTAVDRVLSVLPMSFDYGMNQVTTMFLLGGTVVLQAVALPTEIVRSVRVHGITGLACVPPMWVQIVRLLQETGERLTELRYVTNSGGKIPPSVLRAMPEVFPGAHIYLMYGLTEAFRSSYLHPSLFFEKMGAIGKAVPEVELYVVHPDRGLCGPNESGELIHRGALVSRGYWGAPEITNERIKPCPHLRHLIGDEKVVYTGDTVYRDDDGVLWFEARADQMIKCKGYRISPTEVEDVIGQLDEVGDVVAFGVEDEGLGEAVHVAVAPGGEDGVLNKDRLTDHCRTSMPAYMVPVAFHLFDSPMPRTGSGKIDRVRVVESCKSAGTFERDDG